MAEDNQQLIYLKNKVVKEQRHSEQLEKYCGIVAEKLRKTIEENRIVRQRTQMHHEQNKEEVLLFLSGYNCLSYEILTHATDVCYSMLLCACHELLIKPMI
jgi:hypothetical protein